MANSDITPETIAGFTAQQGHVNSTDAELCRNGMKHFEDLIDGLDVETLRGDVDAIVAQPGDPMEGDCL